MSEPFDTLALYDALSPEERAELDRAMLDNPALAEAFSSWTSLRAAVRKELAQDLPDRAMLVLYALADDDVLDASEAEKLAASRGEVEAALERHPGLVDAIRRIRQDRDAFNAAWAAHASTNGHQKVVEPRQDRPEMRIVRPQVARWPWRIAAMVAVVLCGSLLTFLALRDAGFDTIQADEQMAVELPDGSSVELAEGAVLMVSESADVREARLMAGRAMFDIRHDESNPFVVETPNAAVTVLGTSFGVDVTQAQTDVVLVFGSVELASNGHKDAPVVLEPGERSAVLSLDLPDEPEIADVNAALNWTGDLFIRSEPMLVVAERLSRAFDVTVEVAPELAGEMVSGTRFEIEAGLDAALEELALTLGAEIVPTDNGFRLQ